MAMTPAMESIFANAQQNAASLIETATLAINAKVNTIEEAEAMIQELSSEAVKFNELLTCVMNAMRQVESGDMQKEEAAGIIAPAVKELKDKCTALKIANVEAPGDDITEDEIATLRELIIGAKAAAEDRLVAIRLCDDCKVDPEVENELNPPEENGEAFDGDVSMESYSEDIAIEAAFLASKYVNTTECKTAKALYQNAKKLYSMGSKEKALEYMKKAKSLYEGCLKKLLNESGKFEKAERTDTIKKNNGTSAIRHNVTRTDSLTFAIARSKLENKIDRCTAHILQWTTKAGKETYQQTLDQLKADREQAKAAKKAAKATENYEMEDNNMIDFTEAYESMIDNCMLEELDYEAATEGANNDARKLKKSYSKEIRSLAKEAKKNYKHGNYAEAKTMYTKCASLAKEMAAEVKSIEQTLGQVQIGNLLHSLKTIASCLLVGSLYTGIKEEQKDIQQKIDNLNAAGNGEMTRADMNKYTRDIIFKANAMAEKFSKLAAKAAKGEIEAAGATESYSELMFACEALMDELEADLAIDSAMEAEGEESEGSEKAPSKIASKLRSAFSKLKSAVKRGDKEAADAAAAEVDAAADELDSSEENKEGMSKAAKVGMAAAAAALIATGAVVVGKAMKNKASGSTALADPATAKNPIKQAAKVMAAKAADKKAMKAAKPIPTTGTVDGKKVGSSVGKKVAAGAGAAAIAAGAAFGGKKLYDKKKAAKDAAEKVEEAFGIPAFDVYEVIMESFNTAEVEENSENSLMSAIEAMM